jgi:hypothetical protein
MESFRKKKKREKRERDNAETPRALRLVEKSSMRQGIAGGS